ncbi:Stp1/IreP family PP2C-type Ser/Thr phosphatase [Chloroflexota bacterium]
MNILRRLFGKKQATTQPGELLPAPEAMEAAAAESMTIPGIDGEIAVENIHHQTPPVESVPLGATRQLPPLESALSHPDQHITYGQSSDVGRIRTNNQDAVFSFFASQNNIDNIPDFGLFIVADGMGGHHDGEKASAVASQVLAEQVAHQIYLPLIQNQGGKSNQRPQVIEVLSQAVKTSNDVVVKSVPEGGTTITAATVIGDMVYIAHVGDSRAYLITEEGGIEQITRDHSLVQRLIELDQLTPEEAAHHPQKNVLYRAIGQSDNLEVDAITRRLPAAAYLLLCSDGLWNMVPEETVLDIIVNTAPPQKACDHLITAANKRGGADNISAILLQIPS